MMGLKLLSAKQIRESDSGKVVIPRARLESPYGIKHNYTELLAAAYAKLSQDYPDYQFGILNDDVENTVAVWWTRLV